MQHHWHILRCPGEKNFIRQRAGFFTRDLTVTSAQEQVVSAGLSEVRTYSFGPCRILTLDALITAKEAMGRPHDLLTVVQLKALRARLAAGS